ncbi:MAG TPA: energy-coupling factor transporter transmembrane component T [Methanomassiliicoccales archaeon]|nr:energy-coupling factor transporter transmembrane component T [Methanomassiliicoccales archaeon]
MTSFGVDRFATRSSFAAFDPRVKILCTAMLVVVMAFLTRLGPILIACAFVLLLAAMSGIPARHLLQNYLLALVFIAFASIATLLVSGYAASLVMFLRASTSVLALLVLVTTTPFFMMLEALDSMHMPRLLSSLIMFTYRFIFVLLEEAQVMRQARLARGFSGGRHLLDRNAFRTLSASVGMVFVRAQAKATNIYDALLSRGFTGEVHMAWKFRSRPRDVAFAAAFAGVAMLSIFVQMGVVRWTLTF